jgi:ABC-type Fe3+ transport system permease subunit
MTNSLITAILLGIISAVATWVIVYWHITTKGTWREWPAGRSLMGLLAIISIGFGYGVLNRFLGDWAGRAVFSIILYALFVGAIVFIGYTIRKEMRRGKKRTANKFPLHTGPVTVVVATKNEEIPDVD